MAGRWCCHLADQFVLLSFRHMGAYHYIHWRWPSLCRLDLERTGSVGELLTDCAQGWAVRKQWRGDGAISTTPSRWIATAGSDRRLPTSSPAVYYTRPVRLTTWPQWQTGQRHAARKWEKIVRRARQKKKLHPHISPCWHGPPLVHQIMDIHHIGSCVSVR